MSRRRLFGLLGGLTVVMVVVVVVAVTAAGGGGAAPSQSGAAAGGATTTAVAAAAPKASVGSSPKAAPESASAPASSGKLAVSAERAAARMFLVGFGGPRVPDAVLRRFRDHEWGGVVLEPGNGQSPQQVADVIARLRGTAAAAHHAPPLIAASQLGGDLDAVPVGAPPQSSARDARAARRNALAVAKALHPLGIRMVLAPDADIGFAGGPWEGVAFADDAPTVSSMVSAAVSGWKDGEIAPAPGHFPGEGAASGDPALEAATVGLSLDELRARDLTPFAAVAKHAPAMQLSSATYVAWDGVTPATLLPDVVKLLRDDLGFTGVIVSGDLQAASLAGGQPVARLAVDAVKAGVDLLWIPGDAEDQNAAWRAVVTAMKKGEIPTSRVADALKHVDILRAAYGVK